MDPRSTAFSHQSDDTSTNPPNVRLYNPYQDLYNTHPSASHRLYHLPTSPEFLFQEESVSQRRNWSENLTYYTGCTYIVGSFAGAAKGLFDGVRSFEHNDSLKLRINRILNASGQAGRKIGNRSGVLGLMYAGLESGMHTFRDTDDVYNSIVAGLGTGILFKAASGPRSAAVAGAIGGIAAGAVVAGKQVLKRYVPI